ncbi:MAG: hypothetical protein FD160_3907 [Caulobacteraceae bacterium]|nr:MAG: hypothetical protein FD160_3907 [Caulobacteraceae bacterium]
MTNHSVTLGEQIEKLVREHIAACRVSAREAVDRAFASADARSKPAALTKTSRIGRRRASAEVAALSERLYEAVCARPGEMMTVLGPVVGACPRELHRPMAVLKDAGRVRSVGQRHMTRYFPTLGDAAPAA